MSERRTTGLQSRADSGARTRNTAHRSAESPWVRAAEAPKVEAPAAIERGLRSPAEPLAEKTRDFFEQRFGHDSARASTPTAERPNRPMRIRPRPIPRALTSCSAPAAIDRRPAPGANCWPTNSRTSRSRRRTRSSGSFRLSPPESAAERAAEISAQRIAAGLAPATSGVAQPGMMYRTIKDDESRDRRMGHRRGGYLRAATKRHGAEIRPRAVRSGADGGPVQQSQPQRMESGCLGCSAP